MYQPIISKVNASCTEILFNDKRLLIQKVFVGGRTGLMARASDSGSGDPGSILGRVGVIVSLSKRHLLPKKVLVIPRNRWLRLNMTEKLFTGTLNHNQNKTKQKVFVFC